jgi:ADP-ribose pyrophosphatase
MERIGSRQEYAGKVVSVRVDRFRHSDGSVREREVVSHPGAVAIVAHDDERLFVDGEEQIEVVEVPLADIDKTIEECADAKSIIGLLLLRMRLNS